MSATQPIKNKNDLTRFRNYYKEEELKPRNYALIVMGLNSALRIGGYPFLAVGGCEKGICLPQTYLGQGAKDGER